MQVQSNCSDSAAAADLLDSSMMPPPAHTHPAAGDHSHQETLEDNSGQELLDAVDSRSDGDEESDIRSVPGVELEDAAQKAGDLDDDRLGALGAGPASAGAVGPARPLSPRAAAVGAAAEGRAPRGYNSCSTPAHVEDALLAAAAPAPAPWACYRITCGTRKRRIITSTIVTAVAVVSCGMVYVLLSAGLLPVTSTDHQGVVQPAGVLGQLLHQSTATLQAFAGALHWNQNDDEVGASLNPLPSGFHKLVNVGRTTPRAFQASVKVHALLTDSLLSPSFIVTGCYDESLTEACELGREWLAAGELVHEVMDAVTAKVLLSIHAVLDSMLVPLTEMEEELERLGSVSSLDANNPALLSACQRARSVSQTLIPVTMSVKRTLDGLDNVVLVVEEVLAATAAQRASLVALRSRAKEPPAFLDKLVRTNQLGKTSASSQVLTGLRQLHDLLVALQLNIGEVASASQGVCPPPASGQGCGCTATGTSCSASCIQDENKVTPCEALSRVLDAVQEAVEAVSFG